MTMANLMTMANMEIRYLMAQNRLKQYEVAEKAGYSECYFSRIMRKELKPEVREKVMQAINDLSEEWKGEQG